MIKQVGILGGTGFVGQHLTSRLAQDKLCVRILSRHPQRHRGLLVLPGIELRKADAHDPAQLTEHLQGCDAVINLVGILNESGRDGQGFRQAHVELPGKVVAACQELGIRRLLHMSALHADAKRGGSLYLRSKGEGEYAAQMAQHMDVTSFRPSVIFGPDDSFFNRFAQLLRLTFVFPLACPNARFAPVWVGDVAEAMARSLSDPKTYGHSYNLCGPHVYTLRELVQRTADWNGLRRWIMPLNDTLSKLQATMLDYVPGKPFSLDNYRSLQTNSVCGENHFARFGITPRSVESLVPGYFMPHNPRALYQHFRNGARRSPGQ
jgi:NADH dehydrogenase